MRAQMAIACWVILTVGAIAGAAEKLPPPDEAELAEAQKSVDEVFAQRIAAAASAEAKVAVAKKMAEIAKATEPPALRYALLTGAEKLAIEGRDLTLVVSTVETLAETFDANPIERQVAAFERMAALAKQPADHLSVAKQGLERLDALHEAGEIEAAMRFGRIAYPAAKRGRDPDTLKTLEQRAAILSAKKKAADALATLQAAVEKNPSDTAAQQALGEMLCFARGEWEAGLPHLAQAADEALAALAQRDAANPDAAKERTAVADAWLEQSKKAKKEQAAALRGRALYWYELAVADSTGLTKVRIEKLIKDLAASSTPEVKPGPGGKTPVKAASDELTGIYAKRDPKVHRKLKSVDDKHLDAIDSGLLWLSKHQQPDGGWSFDHRNGPCKSNPGNLQESFNASTAMAILPMLASGHTSKDGKYAANVKGGLTFLIRNMKVSGGAGSLADGGTFYSHGLATIALCEAYGMTGDASLKAPAQAAVNFILASQDPVGGGWRYAPKQPGDTSVTAWQLQALHLAHDAGLTVPPAAVKGTGLFLDSVQMDSGASYGYTTRGDGMATSAAGLYCRTLLGWKFDDKEALLAGAKKVAKAGPSRTNFYSNYYATNLLAGNDELAPAWNEAMVKMLLTEQGQKNHEAGSWYMPGDHGSDRGGRIYCTSMSLLILQASFRYAK